MKPYLLIFLAGFGLVTGVQAQWTVYDPAVHSQMIVSTAEEIAKFVEVVNNQVSQLKTLTDQANTLHHYLDLFGDPSKVALSSLPVLTVELRQTEVGHALGDIESAVDGRRSMDSDGGGLFSPVGVQFKTPQGTIVERKELTYRPMAAVQDATANYIAVSKDITTRRTQLKSEVAKTTEAIKAATTDAEVQKLSALLTGLHTALVGTDQELHQAAASVLVQDAANHADERRQSEAKAEQKRAEFTEGLDRYGKAFQLWSAPVAFPTK